MKKGAILCVYSIIFLTSAQAGNNNVIIGNKNEVKGQNNFQVSFNSMIDGNNNWIVGNKVKLKGSGIKMFGPDADPIFYSGSLPQINTNGMQSQGNQMFDFIKKQKESSLSRNNQFNFFGERNDNSDIQKQKQKFNQKQAFTGLFSRISNPNLSNMNLNPFLINRVLSKPEDKPEDKQQTQINLFQALKRNQNIKNQQNNKQIPRHHHHSQNLRQRNSIKFRTGI